MPSDSKKVLSVRQSSSYYRAAIRGAKSQEELEQLGLMLVEEMENLKAFIRNHGLIPPKLHQHDQILKEDERQGLLALSRPFGKAQPLESSDFR